MRAARETVARVEIKARSVRDFARRSGHPVEDATSN
jgi:hypothetical protein